MTNDQLNSIEFVFVPITVNMFLPLLYVSNSSAFLSTSTMAVVQRKAASVSL
jgi:hypothetical protein